MRVMGVLSMRRLWGGGKILLGVGLTGLILSCAHTAVPPVEEPVSSVIVQATTVEAANDAVLSVGGTVTHTLGIIRSVGAELTAAQIEKLKEIEGITITENQKVKTDINREKGNAW